MKKNRKTVSVLGAGKIGQAVANNLIKKGDFKRVIATRKKNKPLKGLSEIGVELVRDNRKAAAEADIVIICVKPKDVLGLLREIRNMVAGKLVISLAAGIKMDYLRNSAPESKLIRAMPNLAVRIGESFTVYCVDKNLSEDDKNEVATILGFFGKAVKVEESLIDPFTALSGCAPGYFAVIVEALVKAGLESCLPKNILLESIAQSMIGTGRLILEDHQSPVEILKMVSTPGGITEEEIKILERMECEQGLILAIRAGIEKVKTISTIIGETMQPYD